MTSFYNQKLLTCFEIGKAVTSTHDLEQIENTILKRLSELIRAHNWSLYLLDPDEQRLSFELVVGLEKSLLADVHIKVGEGIAGTVALTGEPMLVPDRAHENPLFNCRVDEITGFVTCSLICLPLKFKGEVIGVLQVVNPEDPTVFEESFLPVLSILADFVAISIANARSHKQVRMLSMTDDVTGFHNTRFLHSHLDECIARGQELTLVFMDLDNFKRVVDAHGHMAGSKVLKEVAQVIASQLGRDDRLVRYGGDEFICILPLQGKMAALEKLKRVRDLIDHTAFLKNEGLDVRVTASMGIANYPHDALDKRQLLQMADECMYRSKDRGKDTITLA